MPVTGINDDEFGAFYEMPAEAVKVYLYLRRYADKNGVVGVNRTVSLQALAEFLTVPEIRGRHKQHESSPTRKKVRHLLSVLEKSGLIERRSRDMRLIFYLPMAIAHPSVQMMRGARGAHEGHRMRGTGGANENKGNRHDEGQMRGTPQTADEGHTSPVTSHHKKERVSNDTLSSCERASAQSVLFAHWQSVMNHPKARLDDKRRAAINKALRIGYSVADLKRAIDGCAKSEWHMGKNDRGQVYDALTMIFRDAEQIDKFIRISNAGGAKAGRQALLGRIGSAAVDDFVTRHDVIDIQEVAYGA